MLNIIDSRFIYASMIIDSITEPFIFASISISF